MTPPTFAHLLRAALGDETPYALSKRSGIPQGTLSQYLRGLREPTWLNVCKIALALGIGVEAFAPKTKK